MEFVIKLRRLTFEVISDWNVKVIHTGREYLYWICYLLSRTDSSWKLR